MLHGESVFCFLSLLRWLDRIKASQVFMIAFLQQAKSSQATACFGVYFHSAYYYFGSHYLRIITWRLLVVHQHLFNHLNLRLICVKQTCHWTWTLIISSCSHLKVQFCSWRLAIWQVWDGIKVVVCVFKCSKATMTY